MPKAQPALTPIRRSALRPPAGQPASAEMAPPAGHEGPVSDPAAVLALQKAVGNGAVQRRLRPARSGAAIPVIRSLSPASLQRRSEFDAGLPNAPVPVIVDYGAWQPPADRGAVIATLKGVQFEKADGLVQAIESPAVINSDAKRAAIYGALKVLLDNNHRQPVLNAAALTPAIMALYHMGRLSRNQAQPADERVFGTEVLQLAGWLGGALVASFPALGPEQAAGLREQYRRPRPPQAPADDQPLDVAALRRELPPKLIQVLKAHDPGAFESVRQPFEAAMPKKAALIQERAWTLFPYATRSARTITLTHHGWQYAAKTSDLEGEDVSGSRLALLASRAAMSEVGVLDQVHFKSNRPDDGRELQAVLTTMLADQPTQELVDRHLRATPRTDSRNLTAPIVHLQTRLQKRGAGADAQWHAQWQMIRSLCHELMHVLVHPDFSVASQYVENGQIVSEGFVEVLGVDLYNTILAEARARPETAQLWTDGLSRPDLPEAVPSSELGYGEAAQKALAIRTAAGPDRFQAAFFLGAPHLVGIQKPAGL
ncbi:MAG: hypothetical protein JNK29_01275 [Anaerolineales bacterium]|nr:hypothetical protein [Anaerolineales bacterium]